MKFYLHIGTNKTGTSSIQRSLSDSTELLAENGICYPDTGRDDEYRVAHHPFAELGRNFPRQMAEQVASMVEEAESRGLDSIILSSEAFHTVHAHIVGQALKGHDVEVFAFLRPHAEYYSSWYREAVKSKNAKAPLDAFISNVYQPYFYWLDRWSNVFGLSHVHPIEYDRSKLLLHSSTYQLLHEIGLSENVIKKFPQHTYENPSISGNLLYTKRLINRHISLTTAHSLIPEVLLLSELDFTFRGPLHIPQGTAEKIYNLYESDCLRLQDSYGIDLLREPHEVPGHKSPDPETLPHHKNVLLSFAKENDFEVAKIIEKFNVFEQH